MNRRQRSGQTCSEGEALLEEKYASRPCAYCKTQFVPKKVDRRHKGIFCSRSCKANASKRYSDCGECGKKFQILLGTREKYCSHSCSAAANRGSANPSWAGGYESRTCSVCGSRFSVRPTSNAKCCSNECATKVVGVMQRGRNNPNWRGGGMKECAGCGRQFWCRPSESKAIYCSRECFWEVRFVRNRTVAGSTRWGWGTNHAGKRADIGIFVRSSWEANYARYLNLLIKFKDVSSWEYEPDTFEFGAIKRGTRFYTPDFRVTYRDGRVEYHEVKGWMYPKGATALRRMAKYHPDVKIVLVDGNAYRAISRQFRTAIPGWEGK